MTSFFSSRFALRTIFLGTALACHFRAIPVSAQPDEAPAIGELLKQAHKATSAAKTDEEFSEVIRLCQQALDQGATEKDAAYARQLQSWALDHRGEVRAAAGNSDAALADFEQAVSLDGTRWRAIHNRGVSYAQAGRYKEAEADFDRTLKLMPNYAHGWFNRGEVRYARGDLAAAIKDYDQSLRLAPNDTLVLVSRGNARFHRGELRPALADLTAALRRDANNAAALTFRAEVQSALGNFTAAADDFRKARGLDPNNGHCCQSVAWLMATCPDARFRNPKLAVEAAQAAIKLDGESDHRYLDTLAAAYAADGQFELAVETQTKTIATAQANKQPTDVVDKLAARLERYKNGKPYLPSR